MVCNGTTAKLTPDERLARGLRYTAIGPIDVTRGAFAIGVRSARSSAAELHRLFLSAERRHRRLLVLGALGAVTIVGGAIAFRAIRHSPHRNSNAEPATLSPTVEVTPRP